MWCLLVGRRRRGSSPSMILVPRVFPSIFAGAMNRYLGTLEDLAAAR